MPATTVLIAFGGVSPEHEVSVLTAIQAMAALEELPVRSIPLYISKSGRWYTGDLLRDLSQYERIESMLEKALPCTLSKDTFGKTELRSIQSGWFGRPVIEFPDVALLSFHGSDGENGAFQGVCETFDLPYTGCDVLASAVGMNKVVSKSLCRSAGIPVVEDLHFSEPLWAERKQEILDRAAELSFPLIVKPVRLGSSIGVSTARDEQELAEAVELAFRYDHQVLIEKAIRPLTEINCSVLGRNGRARASVCERPLGREELLSFADKYQNEGGENKGMASAAREIPADIPEGLENRIREDAVRIFSLLGAEGVARLDFLVEEESGRHYFNEINTIPGSFSFYLWEASGLTFPELLNELLDLAKERHRLKNGRIRSYETNLLRQKAAGGLKGLKGSGEKPGGDGG